MSVIEFVLFLGLYVLGGYLFKRLKRLEVNAAAIDTAAANAFEAVGADIGEAYRRIEDLEELHGTEHLHGTTFSSETVNEAVDRVTEADHGG